MSISTAYCPGPSNLFVRAGADATWLHLGMCENDVQVSITPEWEDVFIDGAGPRISYDRQYMGATASVSGDLVFYHEDVLMKVLNHLNDPAATPGTWDPGTIGTLARTEGKAFGLAVVSQYAQKAAFNNNGMKGYWYFPFVYPVGSWGWNQSTRVKRVRMSWDCVPKFDGLGGGQLFTNDVSGLSLPDPT